MKRGGRVVVANGTKGGGVGVGVIFWALARRFLDWSRVWVFLFWGLVSMGLFFLVLRGRAPVEGSEEGVRLDLIGAAAAQADLG
eukprot:scaffold21238_cov34-Isochrysis_galbana.AAC.1